MNSNSIVNLGELSKPATVLIEKVSSAIGVIYEPRRIRREAEANADAALTEAESRITIGELERRAMTRFVMEQTREQKNIEDITTKALPNLDAGSDPSLMDEDWVSDFFAKCRRVSNEEMQTLWSRLLAGEANNSGSVSKRTVDFVAAMDRYDADTFARLCCFSENSFGETLIFDTSDSILADNGISWADLSHMDTIGLIQFGSLSGFARMGFPEESHIIVDGEVLNFTLKEVKGKRQIKTGKVMLTKIGRELRRFVEYKSVDGYSDYCLSHWLKDKNASISCPYPRIQQR